MSGGVDSSVAALLLKEEGYDVIGVSLKLWDESSPKAATSKTCCSFTDVNDARLVADKLGIPFYVFDYTKEFRSQVIDSFVDDYTHGRTPNPCILCNQRIKFELLFHEIKKLGAKYLATGHHARIETDALGNNHLLKGHDKSKDQSYFLFHLLKQNIGQVLFPVGAYTKEEVRLRAKEIGLKVHDKEESMEICFIPDNDHSSFISKNYPKQKKPSGNFVDLQGNVLGTHTGIDAYTIGQRRYLGVNVGKRMFVTEIRPDTNEVVLGAPDELFSKGVIAEGAIFSEGPNREGFKAKVRYRAEDVEVEFIDYDKKAGRLEVHFAKPVRAATPGQALVMYNGDEVIGGGWIKKALYFRED